MDADSGLGEPDLGSSGAVAQAVPSVSIAVPVLNEAGHIDACLAAIEAQTYPAVLEVLVVDGGSTDDTVARAETHRGVTVLRNARRMQAPALNVALATARGEIFVRVDGHCEIAPDYVERCVEALLASGAALVGGAMEPVGRGWFGRGVQAAMTSRFGVGPARFHLGGRPGFVDTVYLGAGRTSTYRALGGFAEDVGVNEDTELAYRARSAGGVFFDPRIRSVYVPRGSWARVLRQFYRYGLSRAATTRRHPGSFGPRQLAAPALVLGLLVGPRRRWIAATYLAGVVAVSVPVARRDPTAAVAHAAVLPAMHLGWGTGFLVGLAGAPPPRPPR